MEYQGQKAIISLTSWKGRIGFTTPVAIYNLINKCPDFHIVLCLSEDEFPQKEKDLPLLIQQLAETRIEILWVKRNYKTLKKVLFTMAKYRNVPVISADDDLLYTCNYAQALYDAWVNSRNKIVTMGLEDFRNGNYTAGCGTLYSPGCFENLDDIITSINKPENEIYFDDDDAFMEVQRCNHLIVPEHVHFDGPTYEQLATTAHQYEVYTVAELHGKIRMKQGKDTNGFIFTYLGL